MYILAEVKARLAELGISPKKSMGQNFLINADSIDRIIKAAANEPSASILEIGPGLGALTERLQAIGHPMILIELDKIFAGFWREKGFSVIEGDALRISWEDLAMPKPVLLVSNLPYQISASVVVERSVNPCGVESMILMFQKEVAQRITSRKGSEDYGMLSVVSQTFWDVDKLFEISSKDFWPPPMVASRVLRFRRRDFPGGPEFLKLAKAAFSQRRKFLIKNLSSSYDGDMMRKLFEKNGINPKARAEDLSPVDFQNLYSALEQEKRES